MRRTCIRVLVLDDREENGRETLSPAENREPEREGKREKRKLQREV